MPQGAWNPTSFVRFEGAYATSTKPARIRTDAGSAYLKATNNPLGPHALVRDFVGTALADWIGLDTFDFALMRVADDDEIRIHGVGLAAPGTAFVTRAAAPDGISWDGTEAGLALVENPEAVALLVAFDTWTRNADRFPPPGNPRNPNHDNVFLSGERAAPNRFRIVAFDHSECFGGTGRDLSGHLATIDQIKDLAVFGKFPAFTSRLRRADLESATRRLCEFRRDDIERFVMQVPADWALPQAAREALCEFVCARASFCCENLMELVGQAPGGLAPEEN